VALDVRWKQWLRSLGAALTVDYRFYSDTWAQQAHTLELGADLPLGEHLSLGLTERAYVQDAVSFWQRTYLVGDGGALPAYRTVDRELSPSRQLYSALRMAWTLGGFTASADLGVLLSRWNDFLYLERRTAYLLLFGLSYQP
jgi:hypothetical protein